MSRITSYNVCYTKLLRFESYGVVSRYNRQEASGLAITLATGANALETSAAVESLLEELKPYFPEHLRAVIPFETSPFVRIAIENVVQILIEAVILVITSYSIHYTKLYDLPARGADSGFIAFGRG